MSIYKRGELYWYKFMWNGQLIRESTKQGNDKVARQMEAAHRTSLAKGEGGIREKKIAPTLVEFLEKRLRPWAQSRFEHSCPNNWFWYRAGLRALINCKTIATAKLDTISGELAAGFAAHEQSRGLAVSSVNSSLRVLRASLGRAVEWGVIDAAPKIKLLQGERHRERVVTPDEEMRYLAAASELLAEVAAVLFDTGLRPDECYCLRWENVTWVNGRNGSLLVTHGKTAAARRVLPMTPRVRATLERRWESAGRPQEGWAYPAPTLGGHIDHSSLKKQHAKAFRTVNAEAKKNNLALVKPFVMYSLRHTFLTRLGRSGCDAWTLARIAGHSSIQISARYVHPNEDAVLTAMSRLGGHNSGHSELPALERENGGKPLSHGDVYN